MKKTNVKSELIRLPWFAFKIAQHKTRPFAYFGIQSFLLTCAAGYRTLLRIRGNAHDTNTSETTNSRGSLLSIRIFPSNFLRKAPLS